MIPTRCGEPDWSNLSELEQQARLPNPDSETQFMGVITVAYCDESEYHKTPGVYVVSGFLGRGPDWFELGRKWRLALKENGLDGVGFHMADCENRQRDTPYGNMERLERDRLQRLFIDLINEAPIWGMATAIELDHWRSPEIAGPMKAALGPFSKPYYQTFQHTVSWMADTVEAGGFPREDRIAFIFDKNKETQGKAKELYEGLGEADEVPNRHRLGYLAFEDDVHTVQLQAADIWAYEVQRHIRERKLSGGKLRWQWQHLHRGNPMQRRVQIMEFDGIEGFAREQGWIE